MPNNSTILRMNIARFRGLLNSPIDAQTRVVVERLLAEEESALSKVVKIVKARW